jgi:hypothetical protein
VSEDREAALGAGGEERRPVLSGALNGDVRFCFHCEARLSQIALLKAVAL